MAKPEDIVRGTEIAFEAVQGYRKAEGKETDGKWTDISTNYQNFWLAISDFIVNKPEASIEEIKDKAALHNEAHKVEKKIHDTELGIFVAVLRSYVRI